MAHGGSKANSCDYELVADRPVTAIRIIRTLLPYTSIALVAAVIYASWTLWSRRQENLRIRKRAQTEESRRDAEVLKRYGGKEMKILTFYATPPVIARGQTALLCYGVNNAAKVHIVPGVEDIAPSLSRCVEVHPASTTTFTLTCEDSQGRQANQSLTVEVTSSGAR